MPYGKPFEKDTGAMARGKRSIPYPSPAILRMIKENGGDIIFSSDCHDKNFLDYGFEEAQVLAESAGFRRAAVIKNGKFSFISL